MIQSQVFRAPAFNIQIKSTNSKIIVSVLTRHTKPVFPPKPVRTIYRERKHDSVNLVDAARQDQESKRHWHPRKGWLALRQKVPSKISKKLIRNTYKHTETLVRCCINSLCTCLLYDLICSRARRGLSEWVSEDLSNDNDNDNDNENSLFPNRPRQMTWRVKRWKFKLSKSKLYYARKIRKWNLFAVC